jgi:uncharacterized protein
MSEIADTGEQFEMPVDGKTAFLTYRREDGALHLLHTEVPKELEGNGLGSQLVRHALDAARAEGSRVVAFCPFVRAYVERHPEYAELVKEEDG